MDYLTWIWVAVVAVVICIHVIRKHCGFGEELISTSWQIIVLVVSGLVTQAINDAQIRSVKELSDSQIQVKYIEIGANMLDDVKSEPDECPPQNSPERIRKQWAVELINRNSPVPIKKDIADALICRRVGTANIQEAPDGLNATGK